MKISDSLRNGEHCKRSPRLMAGIESREEEFTMLDRTTLEKSLVLADEAQGP